VAELDFGGLRDDIAAATMLPEFDQVARRARRVRRRGRFAAVLAVLAVLAMLTPGGVIAARERGGGTTLDPAGPELTSPLPIGPQSPVPAPSPTGSPQFTIVAADGADIGHVYALVDVCRGGSCNLQLSEIQAADQATGSGPDQVGLLRQRPTDFLSGFRVEALSDTALVVSAVPAGGARRYQRIDLGSVADDAGPGVAEPGDRMAVTDGTGKLRALDAKSGQLRTVPNQPPIRELDVGSTTPGGTQWVTGTDPATGALSVSVSRNAGRDWTTAGLGVMVGGNVPTLATYQGSIAYLLTRTVDRDFALFRTTDGGLSWQQLPAALPWPAGTDPGVGYGLVVRPDGSLLAWLATSPALVYAQSTDAGHSFVNVAGPGGPVIAVPDGYASLSNPPRLSSDGSNWADATVSALPITG
jgi:hypothetical protein